jgi:hypothetical protein
MEELVRFEVLTQMITVFRDVMPCNLVERYLSAKLHGIISQKAVIFMEEVKEIKGQNTFSCAA